MPINLSVKINNQLFLTDNIIILNDRPVITWDFDKINSVEIDGDEFMDFQRRYIIKRK